MAIFDLLKKDIKKSMKMLVSRAVLYSGVNIGVPPVRVLGYHGVLGPGEKGNVFDVTEVAFSEQMAELKRMGYRVVRLEEVLALGPNSDALGRAVCIIFDDGILNSAERGVPILEKMGYSATFFLVPNVMGKIAQWATPYGYDPFQIMTWTDAKTLVRKGMTIGSHSLNHKTLSELRTPDLRQEIIESKEALEKALGVEVKAFSVPGGSDDSRLDMELRSSGYRCKFSNETTPPMVRADFMTLPVNFILATDSLNDFRDKVNGARDWLQFYRRLRKRTKMTHHTETEAQP